MRIATGVLLVLVMLATPACAFFTEPDAAASPSEFDHLAQHWVRAYEEETVGEGAHIYRPAGFRAFPPSRFRMQYVFQQDGSCEWFYLAPNDGHHFKPGSWHLDADVLVVKQGAQTVRYRILELTSERLLLQPYEAGLVR